MIVRASALVALVLAIAFAMPVAVEVWLRDGHVTLEQGLRHAQAVAVYGGHEHGAPSDDSASAQQHRHAPTPAAATDAGPVLTTTAPTPFGALWYAVAVTQAALLALSAGRSRRLPPVHAPRNHIPDRLLPPPRRRAHA